MYRRHFANMVSYCASYFITVCFCTKPYIMNIFSCQQMHIYLIAVPGCVVWHHVLLSCFLDLSSIARFGF